jgi:plasminogen activator inhibitor 1 RNA-binding protein
VQYADLNLTSGSAKAAAQSWGATEGQAELKDEVAGEDIAKTEQKEVTADGEAVAGGKEEEPAEPAEPTEPEEKQIAFAEWKAQQEEKKAALAANQQTRKPNEGSKVDKKWANAKPLSKDEDEDTFMIGTGGKVKRERERKTKQLVEIDNRYVEPERPRGGRGGRGGDRGRGGFRGESRGGRGGAGFPRGGSGGRGAPSGRENAAPINPKDTNAFPSLGGA